MSAELDRLKYIFVALMGCLLILAVLFYSGIKRDAAIDKIFDEYYAEMNNISDDRDQRREDGKSKIKDIKGMLR